MVRRFAKSFIILVLLYMPSIAANAQELFLRANRVYEHKDFAKAASYYNQIEPKGRAVWYNIGNCHYYMKQYADAVVSWRRAARGASYKELRDIENNIAKAREQMGISSRKSQPKWYLILRATGLPFPVVLLQLLLLVFWFTLLWLLVRYKGPKDIFFVIKFIILVIGVVWLCSLMIIEYYDQRTEYGVVTQETAVYAGPHDKYHVVGNVRSTQDLEICEERAGWCKIKNHDAYGWIPARTITII